jgi:hypothetical protein
MRRTNTIDRLVQAAEEFNRRENRTDGSAVAESIAAGLGILRESMYVRMYEDVEKNVGKDSMLMPVSESKAEHDAIEAIEVYQAAESAVIAKQARYVNQAEEWYLPWLLRFRLGDRGADADVAERCKLYLSKGPEDRRHAFMDVLARVLPESRDAPLVLFRLAPFSVQIVTARAFGDRNAACKIRREQTEILPAIADCRQCRGQVLECGEECRACGNPLWKYEWLTAVD